MDIRNIDGHIPLLHAVLFLLFVPEADQLVSSGVWRKDRDELIKGMLRSSQRNPGGRTLTVESVRFVAFDRPEDREFYLDGLRKAGWDG